MAAWGRGTFIAMLNLGVKLKAFHQYTVRTKILKALGAGVFVFWKSDEWFLSLVLGLCDFWGDSLPF